MFQSPNQFQTRVPIYIRSYFEPDEPVDLPVIGLTQEVHLLANNSPKQSPQNGFSSLDVKRCPASEVLQLLHVKHSLCHGSFLYVTPPLVIICRVKKTTVRLRLPITGILLTADRSLSKWRVEVVRESRVVRQRENVWRENWSGVPPGKHCSNTVNGSATILTAEGFDRVHKTTPF